MTDVHITLEDIIDAIERGAFDREPNANVLIVGAFARRGKGHPLLSHEIPAPPKAPSTPDGVAAFLTAADAWLDAVQPLRHDSGYPMQVNRCAIELHGKLQETRNRFASEVEADEAQRTRFVTVTKRLLYEIFKVNEAIE